MIGIPFGRETILTNDTHGRIYLLWNETFDIAVFDSRINLIDSIQVNLPNMEIMTDDRNQVFDRLSNVFIGLAERHMPDTKPVARQLKVDPLGRMWVQTYDSPENLVIGNDGVALASFDLSDDEAMMYVDSKRIYTQISDESGTKILVYQYELNHNLSSIK
jgi:hypothetical protein